MRAKNLTKLLAAVGAYAFTGPLQAATTTIDFNTDPVPLGIYTEPAGATAGEWRSSGGVTSGASDGYLSVTDARDSQRGVLIFKDLENGLIVKSFVFECDLRMGGGNDAPADGFSINYASVDDPAITGGAFAGTDGEANLPEEGTQTGLAIGFDTWQSGLIGGVQDVVGISIRVGNRLIAQLPVPVAGTNVFLPTAPNPGGQGTAYTYDPVPYRNLATNDPNYRFSMQTGARSDVNGDGVVNAADEIDQVPFINPDTSLPDPNWYKWMSNLTWARFRAEVTESGQVKLFWKGNEVTPAGGIASGFTPIAGRLIFAARTGGNNQVHHVDNISLVTQPFTSAVVQTVTGNAGGITATILDQSTATLDTNTLVIKITNANGTSTITPSSVVYNPANLTTTIRYNASPLLPLGTNKVNLVFKDNLGFQSDVTRDVIVAAFATANASLAVPAGSVNTATPGFTTRTHQLPIARNQGDNNRIAQAERQLADGYINPDTGLPYVSLSTAGPNADGSYTIPYINWSDAGGNFGNFNAGGTGTLAVTDDPVPGIVGAQDNYVTETVAYLEIPAGYYTFGVNSDDGFEVSFGNGLEDIFGQRLGAFDGGKGASDVLFDVNFPTGGTFPVRITYWEGGGGTAGAEFFYIGADGSKILVGDTAHGSVIKAYTTATTGRRPAVSRVSPEQDQHFVVPDAEVAAWIDDGDITVSSATMTVNGVAVTAAPVKTGSVTKIARPGSVATVLPIGVNNATVVYSYTEGGSTVNVTNSWSFRVLSYGVIPPAFKVAVGDTAGGPAFLARARQIHRRPGNTSQGDNYAFPGDGNRLPRAEYLFAGAYYDPATGQPYPNVAVTNDTGGYQFDLFNLINFNSGVTGTAPDRTATSDNSGVVPNDDNMPGLPITGAPIGAREQYAEGGNDNIAVEFSGLIELKAGSTMLAFNSDDGFLATAGSDPHDAAGVVLGHFSGGRGNSGLPLPNPTQTETPNPGNNTGNTVFAAVVQEDGIYPVRVIYWQGGGGVNAEFLVIDKGSAQTQLVGLTENTWGVPVYKESTLARAYALYPPTPQPWDNRQQQMRVGLPKFWGNSPNNINSGDIYNDTDTRRHFATAEVGAVFTNAVGKTITMTVNGNPVTPTVTTASGVTSVAYRPAPTSPLPAGTNTATITYEGGTHRWNFIVQNYTNVPAGLARPLADAATGTSGFLVKVAQSAAGRANTVVAAEQQLAGTPANVATNNPARADGRYPVAYVNYNNNKQAGYTAAADVGNFATNALAFWPFPKIADLAFPGIANTNLTGNLGRENYTAEITAWLKFDQAGYYPFGVNGDDGWAVHAAEAGVTNGTVLFTIDRGAGNADIPFSFSVPSAGLYPIRLLYYQGGGGGNVELFHYDNDGMKHLVNDPNDANSIKAYYDLGGGSGDRPQITLTRNGNDLTITWTNGGELLSADTVTGPYTGTGDTDGTFTTTINPATPAKFYQVRK